MYYIVEVNSRTKLQSYFMCTKSVKAIVKYATGHNNVALYISIMWPFGHITFPSVVLWCTLLHNYTFSVCPVVPGLSWVTLWPSSSCLLGFEGLRSWAWWIGGPWPLEGSWWAYASDRGTISFLSNFQSLPFFSETPATFNSLANFATSINKNIKSNYAVFIAAFINM